MNVLNFKLTNACNYQCGYCFAKSDARKTLSCVKWKNIVDNIFSNINVDRVNLLGGEPLLYEEIADLADYIRSRGSKVSIITNGFYLTNDKIDLLKKCGVSQIGISIDSSNEETLRKLGRCSKTGDILNPKRCISLCRYIKEKGISLKINTVVSSLNYTEDINSFIKAASPDRWKILKIKEYKDSLFNNLDQLIDDQQFDVFINTHSGIPHVAERLLSCSYIMVDTSGNLIDTSSFENIPVANLLSTEFQEAFDRLDFDYEGYRARYAA